MSANLKSVPLLEPEYGQADHCLACLTAHRPDDDTFTFQTFSETTEALAKRKAYREKTGKKDADPLGGVLNGTLREHWDELVQRNRAGAGICVTINMTDGKGRARKNIIAVRTLVSDHDKPEDDPLRRIACFPSPPSFVVESSIGKYHAYRFVEDVPLDAFTPLQKKLADRFDSDKTVTDLPRVMRLSGFFHQKNDSTPFMTRQYTERDDWKSCRVYTEAEIEAALATKKVTLPARTEEGGRTNELLSYGGRLRSAYAEHDEVLALLSAANTLMIPPCEDDEVEGLAARAAGYPPGPSNTDGQSAEYKQDDIGNGQRFAARHGDDVRFIVEEKVWAGFSRDGLLVRDKGGEVELLAEETARGIFQEAANARNADQAMAIAKHAARTAATPKLEAMLKRARTRCGISITELDTDPLLLGARNGVVDLRTGELLEDPSARDAVVTRSAGAVFNPDATCPIWESFIDRVFDGDPELISYVQPMCGYLLTGMTTERCFFILHGAGDNGKTVFLTVMQTLLGEYSEVMDMSFFMAEHGRGPAPSEVARLQKARIVTATEADHTAEWSSAHVKRLTGSDTLSGRPLYGNTVQFQPGFKIVVAVNHRPQLSQGDPALLGRVREIPFTVTLSKAEQVKGLSDTLCGELSGILNWCVAGTRKWLSEGLAEPVSVENATAANCEGLAIGDSDNQVESWFAEECRPAPGAVLPFAELYEAYKKWSRRETECIRSERWVALRLKKLGVKREHTRAGSTYHGIAITPPVEY